MSRYERQTRLPEIGPTGQARLAAARVLVVGAGGLGSAVLPLLVGAGVGHIRLADPDVVEVGNLHRQTMFRMSDIGHPKAMVAAESLAGLNPDCKIEPLVMRLDPGSAPGALDRADIVIDAADSFAVSYALSDLCEDARLPLISASVLARRGYVGGFCGGAPSLRAVFPDLPNQLGSCASDGVMGPVVATIGALQAQMTLAVLLGFSPSPLGQLMTLDLADWRLGGFRFDGATDTSHRTPAVISRNDIVAGDLVVDLRTGPNAQPRPKPGQRVVFLCTTGLRAWRAAMALHTAGHPSVAIVGDGGC